MIYLLFHSRLGMIQRIGAIWWPQDWNRNSLKETKAGKKRGSWGERTNALYAVEIYAPSLLGRKNFKTPLYLLRVPVCLSSTQVQMKFQQIGALLKRGEFVNAYLFSSLKQTEHNNPVHKRSDRKQHWHHFSNYAHARGWQRQYCCDSNLFSVV